jgi:hypothetical protein
MVHRRDLEGEVLVFGNQGALWGNAMTWFDHDTGTVWSQPLGEAIVGDRKGQALELVASQLTSWETWKQDHPSSVALDAPASPSRFDLSVLSIVVDFTEEVGVYSVASLEAWGPANDVVAGVPIAVVIDPHKNDRWRVFHRRVFDAQLTLSISDGELVDNETGTTWDPATGRAVDGFLKGEILDSLPGFTSLESDARTFWPDAKYWDG